MESRTKGVIAFIALSFGLAWAGMFAAVLLFGLSLVNPLVQIAGIAFAPAIAAFVVRKWITREGFADAGMRPRLREQWRLYLAAWLGPLGFAAAALAVAVALGLWDFDPAAFELLPGLPAWASIAILLVVVIVLTPIYWGEEFGWTSYLRLRLFPERPLMSTVLTGLIWAVWHYPLAFLGYIEFANITLGLAIWTVSFLFQEVILSWLRMSSGSVWTASLAHAGNNMVLALLVGIAVGEDRVNTGALLGLVPMVAVAAWLLLTGRLAADRPADAAPLEREPVAALR
ncbi:CPBP family intramembrane glutamic endopeptidase [Glycomyces algeriensis]|uniref:Peptidase n=1 Tax=Glycomyces algeriensis TaxID=256037 RepID=A0A9W6LG64_9ACTN|nr:CPBP family intramembrane glutamic endopeptidase [Glycomyces algeriensis]MDA1369082.1 CPBP family intramembrane metalloprotease [Glycomyces algeriensis]MDR7348622.1 membrane protease YdiL (CAAX protease family) [Glycomyces algeriensis]GLI41326.1 peptidase [Glycomyces algeriensis]